MKCDCCCLWWEDDGEDYPSCHADPCWPAPCEYEDHDPDVLDDLSAYDYDNNLI